MRDLEHIRRWAASAASAVLILTVGVVPATIRAADHLEAPIVARHGAIDITDTYAFATPNGSRTVLIMSVNPGAGMLPNSGTTFAPGARYNMKIDTNGDLTPDVVYRFRFDPPSSGGTQSYRVIRNGHVIANAQTGFFFDLGAELAVTAGPFDDPFFFDLDAFKGQILGEGDRTFCDEDTTDFFEGLNVTAIVLRVANSQVGGTGRDIGFWATTEVKRNGRWVQRDQMGRPAINTVFNNVDTENQTDRELFNRSVPSEQVSLGFRSHVKDVLAELGAAEPGPLSKVLIPDVLTFRTGDRHGFLNGRRLRNDVIDTELALITDGGITTDCVANDSDFSQSFPYLAPAN